MFELELCLISTIAGVRSVRQRLVRVVSLVNFKLYKLGSLRTAGLVGCRHSTVNVQGRDFP